MSGACPALSASLPHHTIKNVDVINRNPNTTLDHSGLESQKSLVPDDPNTL